MIGLIAEHTGQPRRRDRARLAAGPVVHRRAGAGLRLRRPGAHRRRRGHARPGPRAAFGVSRMSSYTIPSVVEKTHRGERAVDIYSRLLTDRIVYLGTEIDDGVANVVIAQLLHLESESPDVADQPLPQLARAARSPRCSRSTTPCSSSGPRSARRASARPARRPPCCSRRRAGPADGAAARPGGAAPAVGRRAGHAARPRAAGQGDRPAPRRDGGDPVRSTPGARVEQLREDTERDLVLSADEAVAYGIVDGVLGQPEGAPEERGRLRGWPAMTSLADRTIAALRANHDTLAALVPTLTEEQLTAPSGASEWTHRAGALAPRQRRRDQPPADRDRRGGAGRGRGQPGDLGALGRADAGRAGRGLRRARRGVPRHGRGADAEQRDEPADRPGLPAASRCRWWSRSACGSTRSPTTPGTCASASTRPPSVDAELGRAAARAASPARCRFLLGFSAKPDQVEQEVRLAVPGGGIVITDAVTRRRPSARRPDGDLRRAGRGGRPAADRPAGPAYAAGVARDRQRHAGRPAEGLPGLLRVRREADRAGDPASSRRLTREVRSTRRSPSAPATAPSTSELGSLRPRSTSERYCVDTPGVGRRRRRACAPPYGAPRAARGPRPRATAAPARSRLRTGRECDDVTHVPTLAPSAARRTATVRHGANAAQRQVQWSSGSTSNSSVTVSSSEPAECA